MLDIVLQQESWTVYAHPEQRSRLALVTNVEEFIGQLECLPITLKDNHRSLVKRGDLFDLDVVVKQPRDKNRRRWARLTSLFAHGEAVMTIENLSKLEQAGVASVKPVFAAEKRVNNMVVDSWLCYEYRHGEPCTQDDLTSIVEFLHDMHAKGFRHGDPTWNNFLFDQHGTIFTIDTKARPCKTTFDSTNEFLLLKRANNMDDLDINQVAKLEKSSAGYWLAMCYGALKSGRALIRDKVRKNRPRNT